MTIEHARIAKGRSRAWQGCVQGKPMRCWQHRAAALHQGGRSSAASDRGEARMPQERPRVVIAGAGFGGLEAAKALRAGAADVVVLCPQKHHFFSPLLV